MLTLPQSKILVLDEATSAIGERDSFRREMKLLIGVQDYETDSIIQKSLRTELGKDVTLLTVAHRLEDDTVPIPKAKDDARFCKTELPSSAIGKLENDADLFVLIVDVHGGAYVEVDNHAGKWVAENTVPYWQEVD